MRRTAAQPPDGHPDVVDAVLSASRLLVGVASKALAGVSPEVTLQQLRTLTLLDGRGVMTLGELAQELGVAPSTASRMCDRLVSKKLVRRALDPTNRRRVRLTLQPAGRELIAASTRRRTEQVNSLLQAIPPLEQERLASALAVLLAAASNAE